MTAVAELERTAPAPVPTPARPRSIEWRYFAAVALAVANAIVFLLVRPGVEDLWAARAREYAAQHGVGLTYWFGWFSGGSTPGNYSVITPYLSALTSAELLGAMSAVAITVLCVPLLRGTRHPFVGVAVAAVGAASNLWSGRIPFLLGSAFAVAAFLAARHHRRVPAALAGVLAVFASPVAGAFLALGLAGTFLSRKSYRAISVTTIVAVGASMVLVAIVFGNPGPEDFGALLCLGVIGGVALCLFARPADYIRTTLLLIIAFAVVLAVVPNGLGSNLARVAWFYVPVAVVALGGRRLWVMLLLIAPLVFAGVYGAVGDVRTASQPMSNRAYYTDLATELDSLPQLLSYRLEVVTLGSHAADTALLDHAMLARGWETQEDDSFNKVLMSKALNSVSYKVWLDNNAVGYVAVPRDQGETYPEYELVTSASVPYLHEVWENVDWELFQVANPVAVVSSPGRLVAHSQSRLTFAVPMSCFDTSLECSMSVRVRYSKFLRAAGSSGSARPTVSNDGYGWTMITTTQPGDYYLYGTMTGLFG